MRFIVFGAAENVFVATVNRFGRWDKAQYFDAPCPIGGLGFEVAVGLARTGLDTALAASIGPDGRKLMNALKRENVDTAHVCRIRKHTPACFVQLRDYSVMERHTANPPLSEEEIDRALESYGEGDMAVVIDDTPTAPYAAEAAKRKGMKVMFCPGPARYETLDASRAANADYIWVSMNVASIITGEVIDTYALRAMKKRYPESEIVMNSFIYRGLVTWEGEVHEHERRSVKIAEDRCCYAAYIAYFLRAVSDGAPAPYANNLGLCALCECLKRKGAYKSLPQIDAFMLRLKTKKRKYIKEMLPDGTVVLTREGERLFGNKEAAASVDN